MKPLIIANWKANKTIAQANDWVEAVRSELENLNQLQIVVCGAYVLLPTLKTLFSGSVVKVGAQNVSRFQQGAFTGEVVNEMLAGLADYCIVGHSERQKYFGETLEDVVAKIKNLLAVNIIPVLCVANPEQLDQYLALDKTIQEQKERVVFVYEPPKAISSGGDFHPETPAKANENCQKLSERLGGGVPTVYGGSVNTENIQEFLAQPFIYGVLPGQASLKPEDFLALVKSANLSPDKA